MISALEVLADCECIHEAGVESDTGLTLFPLPKLRQNFDLEFRMNHFFRFTHFYQKEDFSILFSNQEKSIVFDFFQEMEKFSRSFVDIRG